MTSSSPRRSIRSTRPDSAGLGVFAATTRSTPTGSSSGSSPATYSSSQASACRNAVRSWSSPRYPSLTQVALSSTGNASGRRRSRGSPYQLRSAVCTLAPSELCAHGGPFGGPGRSTYAYRYRRGQSSYAVSLLGVHTNNRSRIPSKPSCTGPAEDSPASRTSPILPPGCDTERWRYTRAAATGPGSDAMGFLRWLRGGDENGAAASAISAGLAEIDGLFRPSKHKQTEHVEESKRRRIDVANAAGSDLDNNIAVSRPKKA